MAIGSAALLSTLGQTQAAMVFEGETAVAGASSAGPTNCRTSSTESTMRRSWAGQTLQAAPALGSSEHYFRSFTPIPKFTARCILSLARPNPGISL